MERVHPSTCITQVPILLSQIAGLRSRHLHVYARAQPCPTLSGFHPGFLAGGGGILSEQRTGGIPPPPPQFFYKTIALRLNLVGFGSIADYPMFCL